MQVSLNITTSANWGLDHNDHVKFKSEGDKNEDACGRESDRASRVTFYAQLDGGKIKIKLYANTCGDIVYGAIDNIVIKLISQ